MTAVVYKIPAVNFFNRCVNFKPSLVIYRGKLTALLADFRHALENLK